MRVSSSTQQRWRMNSGGFYSVHKEEKKLQISKRQTIPCCNVGLQSDLQSPCHMHSSETPLTVQSERQ